MKYVCTEKMLRIDKEMTKNAANFFKDFLILKKHSY